MMLRMAGAASTRPILIRNRHGVGGSVMRRSPVIFLDLPDAACGFRIAPPFATISASPEFIGKTPK